MSDAGKPSEPRARVLRVSGRTAKDPASRGLPKIDFIAIEDSKGVAVEAHLRPPTQSDSPRTANLVCEIRRGQFPFCPICFSDDPADTDEHVPPRALGGHVMANTCARCNNDLGSRTESAMQDWFDRAVRVRFTSDSDPRPFGTDRAFLRDTTDGKFVLMLEKAAPIDGPGLSRLRDPNPMMHTTIPRAEEYMTGLLKNAFLTACLHMGGVPNADSFQRTRAELLAARDAKSRRAVALGDMAGSLRVHRTGAPASGPPLALLKSEEGGSTTYLLSLAGTVLIEWPFSDVDPLSSRFLRAS